MYHPPPLTSPNRETRRRLACSCLFLPSRAEASRLPSGGPAPDHTAHLFLAAGLEWLETGSSPPRHHDIHVMTILFVLTPGGRRVRTRRTAFTTRDRRRSSVRGEGGDTAHASCLPACLPAHASLSDLSFCCCRYHRALKCPRHPALCKAEITRHGHTRPRTINMELHIGDLAILVN